MHYELVYASRIAPGLDPRFVADIVRRARVKNRRIGVTGLLVFDGESFCQLLEGGQLAVLELAEAIERDPRHEGYRVLHEGPRNEARRFDNWHMAYGLLPGDDLAELLAGQGGEQIAGYLQSLVSGLADFSFG